MEKLRLIDSAGQAMKDSPDRKPEENKAKRSKVPIAGTTVYIGLDVSSTKWAYAVRWDGQKQWQQTGPAELRHLEALVAQYRHCRVKLAYEACGFGYEIAWRLRELGVEVVVVAPSRMKREPGLRVKSDRVDAAKLALDLEKSDLKGIWVPDRVLHEHRAAIRTYRQAMRDRGRSAARIRLLMQEHGRLGPRRKLGWAPYAKWLSEQEMPVMLRECVDLHLAQRTLADRMAKKLHKEIIATGKLPRYAAVVKALKAQPGVGEFAATVFVLEMGDLPTRFRTADSIANYLGVTPSVYGSGEVEHRGAILKCGPGAVRALLVQCAWAAVNWGKDSRLREAYERVLPRAGKKRAIIAVARRLSLRLRARWLEVVAATESAASAEA